MFNSLFITSHLSRRRHARARKTLDEVQLVFLRQIIRLSKFLNRAQVWISPLRAYYWLPVLAFLFGMMIGLVITAVT
jgi:hypothetical protein